MGIETLIPPLLPNLHAFARSLSGNSAAADDLVQEAVLKAWENQDQFQEGTNIRAWLFTILRNVYISQKRKKKYEIEDVDAVYAGKMSCAAPQESYLRMLELAQAWEHLPQDQQDTLRLIVLEGMPYEDAALVLGCEVGTTKSRINRARTTLASMLGEELPKSVVDTAFERIVEALHSDDSAEELPSILQDDL